MEITKHTPEPVPATYDITGLTEDEVFALKALLGKILAGSQIESLWDRLYEALGEGHRYTVMYKDSYYAEKKKVYCLYLDRVNGGSE